MLSYVEVVNKARDRPPSLLACITCRKKHLKCDAVTPICGRCNKRKLPCVYVESQRGYKGRKKQNENESAASEAGSEDRDDTMDSVEENMGDKSPLSAYPLAPTFQDGLKAFAPASIASPMETIPRTACFDQQEMSSQSEQGPEDLLDVFYRSFFPAHGFVVPRKLLLQCPKIIPEELKAVMRYVGSHYSGSPQDALRNAASGILSTTVEISPGFMVQGRLCLAMMFLAGRHERALGTKLLKEAIEIALSIGLHRKDYSTKRVQNHPMLAESWRRTWWDLYIVDTLLSALDGSNYKSRLQQVTTDVPLPGKSEDYNNCCWKPPEPTLQEMRNRLFSETTHSYSSEAYKVEATRIMGTVLALEADTFNVSNSQVESIDASIQAFLLSLPTSSREVVETNGKVDEVLFAVHMIIHWASIALHRPRSNLNFVHNHYKTACSSNTSISIPVLSGQSHTAKAIRAANAISKLTAIQTPPALHTPCFACAVALSATVHLPAYLLQDDKDEIRERLHLSISALAAIGEVWPMANIVRAQVAHFARETFRTASFPAAIAVAANMPAVAEPLRHLETDLLTMLDDDSWMSELDAFTNMPTTISDMGTVQSGWNCDL